MRLFQSKLVHSLTLLLIIAQIARFVCASDGDIIEARPNAPITTPYVTTMDSSDESVDLCDSDNEDSKPADWTKGYYVQHTMYRIKDPRVSLPFYSDVLGMTLLNAFSPDAKGTFYFLAYEDADDIPADAADRIRWALSREGVIQLYHIWGSEDDATIAYNDGNSQLMGFGHIGIVVPDVYGFCDQLQRFNVTVVKRPDEGPVQGAAFIVDPDGYLIEIFSPYKVQIDD